MQILINSHNFVFQIRRNSEMIQISEFVEKVDLMIKKLQKIILAIFDFFFLSFSDFFL